MISAALVSHLRNDAGVAALCRFIFPQKTAVWQEAPAIVYTIESDGPLQLLHGSGAFREATVSIDCYDSRYERAYQIADAVEAALLNYVGQLGSTTPAVDVNHIRYDLRRFDKFETDTELHAVSMQFLIGYEVA